MRTDSDNHLQAGPRPPQRLGVSLDALTKLRDCEGAPRSMKHGVAVGTDRYQVAGGVERVPPAAQSQLLHVVDVNETATQ